MKTFEELSAKPDHHKPVHPEVPDLCGQLPPTHPICSGNFPGQGTPNPPPLSPIPEVGTALMFWVGISVILYILARRRK